MIPNIEDVKEVVIGRYYRVPTVIVPGLPPRLAVVPVIGPSHEDADIIGFPHRHYHPDRRFVSDAWLDQYNHLHAVAGHWSVVYSFFINERDTGMIEGPRKRMVCKRLVASFRKDAPWLAKLEKAYCSDKLRDGHICPHRGISCAGVKAESDGVVCPGHGLKFSLTTGRLVSRIGQSLQPSLL